MHLQTKVIFAKTNAIKTGRKNIVAQIPHVWHCNTTSQGYLLKGDVRDHVYRYM